MDADETTFPDRTTARRTHGSHGDEPDANQLRPDAAAPFVDVTADWHRAQAIAAMNMVAHAEVNANDVLSIVSHDLLAPLTAITGVATLIRGDACLRTADRQLQVWAEDLVRSASHMERLIRDLEFDVFESGQLRLMTEHQSLAPIVHQTIDVFLPLAAAKSIGLTTDIAGSVMVNGDAARIFHVLSNLVDNAIKFTPAGGLVRVRVSRRICDCMVAVIDTGAGIPKANLASMFAPLTQREAGEPNRRALGLYVSRLIVEAHGGRIWAETEARVGSTLYFTLPAA
jgi:signal transduction histidine kinase